MFKHKMWAGEYINIFWRYTITTIHIHHIPFWLYRRHIWDRGLKIDILLLNVSNLNISKFVLWGLVVKLYCIRPYLILVTTLLNNYTTIMSKLFFALKPLNLNLSVVFYIVCVLRIEMNQKYNFSRKTNIVLRKN